MRSLLALVLALGCTFAVSEAHAKSRVRASPAVTLDDQVMTEVKRTLPSGLAVASISVPETLRRRATNKDIVALRWRQPPKKGRAIVQVLVHKRSGRIKKGWARIELVEFGKVVVAAVDLEAGEIIEAGHLRVEERPRTEANVVQVEPTYLLGSRVVLARQAGEALRDSDVSMPMPIARGTEVRVIVRRGGVVVATSGVLETKSMVGSPARVRVSGKLLSGKLMSSDLVELGGVL